MHERATLIIGIDAGTSVIKSVAFTLDGEQLGVASRAEHLQSSPGAAASSRTWCAPGHDTQQTLRDLAAIVPDLASARGRPCRDRAGRRHAG